VPQPRPLASLSELRGSQLAERIELPLRERGFFNFGVRQVKVYPNRDIGKWAYLPHRLRLFREIQPPKAVARLKNKQSLTELSDQVEKGLEQLVLRAHSGDTIAAATLIQKIQKVIRTLEMMAGSKSPAVLKIAKEWTDWPVNLSLNPQDIAWAKKTLSDLKVGTKGIIPSNKRQRVNFRAIWTTLAKEAFRVCWLNRRIVPDLLRFTEQAKLHKKTGTHLGAKVSASFYYINNDEVVVISDWQMDCATLSRPTEKNFDAWWNVINRCVLEYWHCSRRGYAEALEKVGNPHETESRRRNVAMTEVRQAFRGLLGLRSKAA
jgi:hypothetical protein